MLCYAIIAATATAVLSTCQPSLRCGSSVFCTCVCHPKAAGWLASDAQSGMASRRTDPRPAGKEGRGTRACQPRDRACLHIIDPASCQRSRVPCPCHSNAPGQSAVSEDLRDLVAGQPALFSILATMSPSWVGAGCDLCHSAVSNSSPGPAPFPHPPPQPHRLPEPAWLPEPSRLQLSRDPPGGSRSLPGLAAVLLDDKGRVQADEDTQQSSVGA